MAKKPIRRTLQLKPIQFSKDEKGDKRLLDVMLKLNSMCPKVGNRLWAKNVVLDDGTLIPQTCFFFNNFNQLDERSCIFEVWSYEPGSMPVTLIPDLDLTNAEIDEKQWEETERDGRELIHISHVLVYGKCAIIECTRGTGGVNSIQQYLNALMKALAIPRTSRFYFTDAVSGSLQREIKRGGGAVGFTLGISAPKTQSKSPLLGMLSTVKSYMPSSALLTIDWKSKETLSSGKVIDAYNEALGENEIDSVIIHLKDGSSIRRMSKFKIKKNVDVADIGGKNPSHVELSTKMLDYLEELTTADELERVLDENGALVDNEIFIPNSRRTSKRSGSESGTSDDIEESE